MSWCRSILATRELRFSNGIVVQYDALVSSVPLPELIRMIQGAPPDVVEAARRLACSTCVLVNIGVDREDLSSAHMTYFYDEDICFTRLGFPHMLSANNAPPGTGSIQAEVYFSSKYKPFTGSPEDWIEPVISDLRRCGMFREDDKILSPQGDVAAVRQYHLRPRSRGRSQDGPRLSRRSRHRLLRTLRGLGIHVDGRELQERGGGRGEGPIRTWESECHCYSFMSNWNTETAP